MINGNISINSHYILCIIDFMADYILSIDQGTTSTRCILFNKTGDSIATAQQEIKQSFPFPGWVEHDSNEIWESVKQTYNQVLKNAGIDASQIATIGITNQRETTVLWNRTTGLPVYPAIVWQSKQSESICKRVKATGLEKIISEKTGLVVDTYFSASKIAWILENVEEARMQAEVGNLAFGTIDTWILWNLTEGKVHATDFSNASRTLLFNIQTHTWDAELLSIFGIPSSILPEVKDSSGYFGTTSRNVLGAEISINGIAGDQQAALFGQGCILPGMAKNTYGTGCFMLINTGNKRVVSQQGMLTTIAWGVNGEITYALEGSVFAAGSAIQWLRDGLKIIDHASQAEEIANETNDCGGVYFVPAFVGLGAPYWNSEARGSFFGLTRGTKRSHLVRAALESMAFQTRDVFDVMQNDADLTLTSLRVDGGATENTLLLQFQSDLLQVNVDKPQNTESTALGAALLAGLSVGIFASIEDCASIRKSERVYSPEISSEQIEKKYALWKKAVQATLAFHAHSDE
jgi:glycerol kinase